MRNLAGNQRCDEWIAEELRRSMIPSQVYIGPLGEVPSLLLGHLGPITFRRAWTYWVAHGPVPIDLARALYADPVGATDIRVDGHCGCPPPEPPWTSRSDDGEIVTAYHIDSEVGLRVSADAIRSLIAIRTVSSPSPPTQSPSKTAKR